MSNPDGAPEARSDTMDDYDFETIEAAVMETPRGRWFLREYARRIRAQESERMLSVLDRIEQTLQAAQRPRPPQTCAREPETRIVTLGVHHRLLELADALRRRGVEDFACLQIERYAHALLEVARRRDLVPPGDPPALEGEAVATADRAAAQARALAEAIAPAHNGARLPAPEPQPAAPARAAAVEESVRDRHAAFAAIEALDRRSRSNLFA
jgi:hypothetical protein